MKANTKKGLIWSGGGILVAGIAASIAVPLTLEEMNKKNENTFSNDDLWDGFSLDKMKKITDSLGIKDTSIIQKALYSITEELYKKEVEYSQEFRKLYYKDFSKGEVYPGYDSQVPAALGSFDEIKKSKTDQLEQEKETFKSNYGTEDTANAAWAEHMRTVYGGATSSEEAVDFLVNEDIQEKAFVSFKFSYKSMDKFIFDKMFSGNAADYSITSNTFSLIEDNGIKLGDLATDGTVDGERIFTGTKPVEGEYNNAQIYQWNKTYQKWIPYKQNVVYFLGSDSKDQNGMVIKSSDIQSLIKHDEYSIKNMVLGLKYNETDATNPMDIDSAFVSNMLTYLPNLGVNNYAYKSMETLFKGADSKEFFARLSPKPDSTASNGGSLGIMTLSDAINTFVPGFFIGLSEFISENPLSPPTTANPINTAFDAFVTGTQPTNEHLAELFKQVVTNRDRQDKDKIEAAAKALTPSEMETLFGQEFKKVIPNAQPVIKFGDGYLVYSAKFGYHYVEFEKVSNANLSQKATEDLKFIAQGKSKEVVSHIDQLLTKQYDTPLILNTVISDAKYADIKASMVKKLTDADSEFKITDLEDVIKQVIENKNESLVLSKYNSSTYSDWIKQVDSKIRDNTVSSANIYKHLLKGVVK